MIAAGKCTDCGALIWRTAVDPMTGGELLLWPMPHSRYVRVRQSPDALGNERVAVGVAFCADCCPEADDAPHPDVAAAVSDAQAIAAVETAHERYRFWFTAGFGEWLRAHARDYLKMDETQINILMALWESDR